MKKYFLILILINSGCSTVRDWTNNKPAEPDPSVLKETEKYKEYIEATGVDAPSAYQKAKTWAASAYKFDSKSAIQFDDEKNHKFLARGFLNDCRGLGSIHHYEVSFLIDFEARDKRVRILFDKILMTDIGMQNRGLASNPMTALMAGHPMPETKDELYKISVNCLEPIKNGIITEIASKKGSEQW